MDPNCFAVAPFEPTSAAQQGRQRRRDEKCRTGGGTAMTKQQRRDKEGMLSLERYGDQQLRRRACSEFVADRAMILMLLEVILFYKLNFTSKERFHAG